MVTNANNILAVDRARRILQAEIRLMKAGAAQAGRHRSIRAIHDLRVAIRRFRTALKVFGPLLPGREAKQLRQRLQAVSGQLGPIRDAQVWLRLVKKTVPNGKSAPPADWVHCAQGAKTACQRQLRTLDRVLRSTVFTDAQEFCRLLHTIPLARLSKRNCGQTARPFLAQKLYRAIARILENGDLTVLETAEEVHALRRRCRRAKYLSEFSEPMLGRHVGKLTRRLTHMTDALGNWHDADVQAGWLDAKTAPKELRRLVAQRRRKSQRKFMTAWQRLTAPHFRKPILAALRATGRHSPFNS